MSGYHRYNKSSGNRQRKAKVYVTVSLASDKKTILSRNRTSSSDVGGYFLSVFTSSNIRNGKVYAHFHRERSNKVFKCSIPQSTYTARRGFEKSIRSFIAENPRVLFLGPCYHKNSDGRDRIIDTQLYVSGSIEADDEDAEFAARREIAEEIGMEVLSINFIETRNGDFLFHATV